MNQKCNCFHPVGGGLFMWNCVFASKIIHFFQILPSQKENIIILSKSWNDAYFLTVLNCKTIFPCAREPCFQVLPTSHYIHWLNFSEKCPCGRPGSPVFFLWRLLFRKNAYSSNVGPKGDPMSRKHAQLNKQHTQNIPSGYQWTPQKNIKWRMLAVYVADLSVVS